MNTNKIMPINRNGVPFPELVYYTSVGAFKETDYFYLKTHKPSIWSVIFYFVGGVLFAKHNPWEKVLRNRDEKIRKEIDLLDFYQELERAIRFDPLAEYKKSLIKYESQLNQSIEEGKLPPMPPWELASPRY